MTADTAAKKDIQKLQRAIVDGLEDVKAQEIQVFNTEHLSPLFERVVVASGTSNRQTRALASSVVDAVRDAGFGKPRLEGEDNGEWIIVDCGAAVVHVMQPAIRQYYQLEDIWGEKPVRLRLGAPKPAAPAAPKTAGKASAKAPAKAVSAGRGRGVAAVRDAAPVKSGLLPAAKSASTGKSAAKASAPGGRSTARPAAKAASATASPRGARSGGASAPKTPAKPASRAAAPAPARAGRSAPAKSAAPAAKPARKVPARKA